MANHLVIGLGGTGGSVLRSLRKRMYEEFRSNEPEGNAHIEYLYVDSDVADLNNEKDWKTLGTSVQLAPAQRLFIQGINSHVLTHLEQYPGIHSFVTSHDVQTMQEEMGDTFDAGMGGQRRRLGRMLLANNMCGLPQDTFVGQVHSRVRVLKEQEDVDDVTFHICAGLGGGIGSGTIVDAVTQIRNEFQRTGDDRSKYKILLYLYVPEKIIQIPGDEASNRFYQPNGYAALLELNAMSVGVYHPTDVNGNTDEFGNVRRLLKGQDAFDRAYLYTNVNEDGKEINIYNELPTIVGDFLFQKIVASTTFGSRPMLQMIESEVLLPEENESQEAVHSRKFMTFGVSRIEYPETEVVEYGAYKLAVQSVYQMLYGCSVNQPDLIHVVKSPVRCPVFIEVPADTEKNLLDSSYLTLAKPLPFVQPKFTSFDPVFNWNILIENFKEEAMNEKPNAKWIHKMAMYCAHYFKNIYRGCGVYKFYHDSELEVNYYAEEITKRIETNLFNDWQSGSKSISHVYEYIEEVISQNERSIAKFQEISTTLRNYLNDEIDPKEDAIVKDWNINCVMISLVRPLAVKKFNKYVEVVRERYITLHKMLSFNYAAKLLSQVNTELRQLNQDCMGRLKTNLAHFAERMDKLAEERCKWSEESGVDLQDYLIKLYDPTQVRSAVQTILLNKQKQGDDASDLRNLIVDSLASMNPRFSDLARNFEDSTHLEKIVLNDCKASIYKDLDDFSTNHPECRLVHVNILDKLRHTTCITEEMCKQFVKYICDKAQSLLTYNHIETAKGSGETAANHCRLIFLYLPNYEEDSTCRDAFIQEFRETCKFPFYKDHNVIVNFNRNQMVVVTVKTGLPLRYVDNVRVLKEKYDALVRNEVRRMLVHTETFDKELPSLYNDIDSCSGQSE